MPVVMVPKPEATCDTCGSKYGVTTCAVCGGVFCEKHSVTLKIERMESCRLRAQLWRAVCDSCIRKNPDLEMIVHGASSCSWGHGESENREEYIAAILEGAGDET